MTKDTHESLKSCPFCGGNGSLEHYPSNVSKWQHVVECECCSFTGVYEATPWKAIKIWNTRANPVITDEAIERGARAIFDIQQCQDIEIALNDGDYQVFKQEWIDQARICLEAALGKE